ncbi:MAG: response regulator transcription factor [Clostridiales bacterium]|nr:response regulator transcription factor [Clostridiales bacterium]
MLIVDDDFQTRKMVCTYAELELFQCTETENVDEALKLVQDEFFDVVILDAMMPGKDGLELLEEIRKETQTPVIMLVERGGEHFRLKSFQLGTDDYISKPFSPRELMLRVNAVLRRTRQQSSDELIYGGLRILLRERRILVKGEDVRLSPKEFDLLVKFARNENIVLRREQLLQSVWGYEDCGDTRTVSSYVRLLREHLGEYRKLIQTVWGVGYRFAYRPEE